MEIKIYVDNNYPIRDGVIVIVFNIHFLRSFRINIGANIFDYQLIINAIQKPLSICVIEYVNAKLWIQWRFHEIF